MTQQEKWEEKCEGELDQIVDDIRGQAYHKASRALDTLVGDLVQKVDSQVQDCVESYADGIDQETMRNLIIKYQCRAEIYIKKAISDYVRGY